MVLRDRLLISLVVPFWGAGITFLLEHEADVSLQAALFAGMVLAGLASGVMTWYITNDVGRSVGSAVSAMFVALWIYGLMLLAFYASGWG